MSTRHIKIGGISLCVVAIIYLALPGILEQWMMPKSWVSPTAAALCDSFADRAGMVPVAIYDGDQRFGRGIVEVRIGGGWRAKALHIDAVKGQAFVGDEMIPFAKIPAVISEAQYRGVDFVIVSSVSGGTWNSVLPVVDQCRKSVAHRIFLDLHPSISRF